MEMSTGIMEVSTGIMEVSTGIMEVSVDALEISVDALEREFDEKNWGKEEIGLANSIAVFTWMKYKKLGFWTRGQGDKGTRGIGYQQSFSLSPHPLVPPSLRAKVYLTHLRTAIISGLTPSLVIKG